MPTGTVRTGATRPRSTRTAFGAVGIAAALAVAVVGVPRADAAITCFGRTPTITGTAASEPLSGTPGDDVIFGGAGNDVISGLGGNDLLCGGAGGDTLLGGAGNDSISGSADFSLDLSADTVSYEFTTANITVNLLTGAAKGEGNDTLRGIDNARGGAGRDRLIGSNSANRLEGMGNLDWLQGRGANDTLDGGADDDMVVAFLAATVNLTTDIATGEGVDALFSIEDAEGGPFNDTLLGDSGDNVLQGMGGNDYIDGGDGYDSVSGGSGNDTLLGGPGADQLSDGIGNDLVDGGTTNGNPLFDDNDTYGASDETGIGVTIDLVTGTGNHGGTDTIVRIEYLTGTPFDDTLIGNALDNSIAGGAGNDVLRGNNGNDSLFGRDGNDELRGGGGTDSAAFSVAPNGVTVSLVAGTATGAGNDTLFSIENLSGSDQDDTLIGNAGPNRIVGGQGTDTCIGNGGADTLIDCP